jgi:uncharacterized membrane protein YeiH
MTDMALRIQMLFDYTATFAWATSGAVVAIRKRFDITGVFVIALLSSTGGGFMRDSLFLQRTPSFLLDPVYLPLILAATLLMSLFTRKLSHIVNGETIGKLVDLIDALGTPAFAVVGMLLAENRGIPIYGILFVGVVNGVAGGLLRDVAVRDVPALLRPGQFVSLALVLVCGLFMVLKLQYAMNPTHAAWITIGVFFLIRILALRFNWRTQPILREPEGSNGDEETKINDDRN